MKVAVSIIIENSNKEFLFFLRDDKPSISYPNQWSLLGGGVENGETFEDTIVREMAEEIELQLENFEVFKEYHWPGRTEKVFYKRTDINIKETPLHEGQKLKFFTKDEVLETDLAFHDNEIMKDFFKE